MHLLSKLLRLTSIILLSIFALSILIHINTNLDQDLGRHIKTGEIIWETESVPKTNLFSYTHPNFPFINHHWGSEVVFYLLYKNFGILSISYLKIFLILLTLLILLYTSLKLSSLPISLISLTIFLPLLMSRSDERPEIFGFLFFAIFLAILIKFKQNNYQGRAIWLLPFVQLLWTNFHITFIYGFLLIFLFLVDAFLNRKFPKSLKLLPVLTISLLLSLFNPNGLSGLLYPLNVFKNYGYTIVENQNLFYLSIYTSNIFINIFWLQAAILTIVGLVSFLISLKAKTIKTDIFYLFLVSCFLFLSIIMYRNLPFFVFTAIISFSYFLNKIIKYLPHNSYILNLKSDYLISLIPLIHLFLIIPLLLTYIYLVTSNNFYNTFDLNKKFELRIDSSYQKAVDFFIENKLPGPIFNNFDIGGYLDFRFYNLTGVESRGRPNRSPRRRSDSRSAKRKASSECVGVDEDWGCDETGPVTQKIFIDNRPEAYPISFFEEYKAAQLYPDRLDKLIKKYKINSIIFSHTDGTDWGTSFIKNSLTLKDFKLVYLDSHTLILTRKDFPISLIAPITQIPPYLSYLDFLHLSRVLSLLGQNNQALTALEKAYNKNPSSCITRLNYGSFLALQQNLVLQRQGISILKSTWYCPFPKRIKEELKRFN